MSLPEFIRWNRNSGSEGSWELVLPISGRRRVVESLQKDPNCYEEVAVAELGGVRDTVCQCFRHYLPPDYYAPAQSTWVASPDAAFSSRMDWLGLRPIVRSQFVESAGRNPDEPKPVWECKWAALRRRDDARRNEYARAYRARMAGKFAPEDEWKIEAHLNRLRPGGDSSKFINSPCYIGCEGECKPAEWKRFQNQVWERPVGFFRLQALLDGKWTYIGSESVYTTPGIPSHRLEILRDSVLQHLNHRLPSSWTGDPRPNVSPVPILPEVKRFIDGAPVETSDIRRIRLTLADGTHLNIQVGVAGHSPESADEKVRQYTESCLFHLRDFLSPEFVKSFGHVPGPEPVPSYPVVTVVLRRLAHRGAMR